MKTTEEVIERYQLLQQTAREAGKFALKYFKEFCNLEVIVKGVQDLVSKADRETEMLIKKN